MSNITMSDFNSIHFIRLKTRISSARTYLAKYSRETEINVFESYMNL